MKIGAIIIKAVVTDITDKTKALNSQCFFVYILQLRFFRIQKCIEDQDFLPEPGFNALGYIFKLAFKKIMSQFIIIKDQQEIIIFSFINIITVNFR